MNRERESERMREGGAVRERDGARGSDLSGLLWQWLD